MPLREKIEVMEALEILKNPMVIISANENHVYSKKQIDQVIVELEEAMKPKTCDGCKTLPFVLTELAKKNGGKCGTCKRYVKDNFEEELKKAYIGGSNDAWKARKEKE